jgi:hypothetical protein
MSSLMKCWLQDESPVTYNSDGNLVSPFPFEEFFQACQQCHSSMVRVCGLLQCPACPSINQWLQESREKLSVLKRRGLEVI